MKWAHLRAERAEHDEVELKARFESFEGILFSFVGNFFTGVKELDAILSNAEQKQIEAALPLLSSPQYEKYFFERLEDPSWIRPLEERGFFRHPPPPEQVEGGGTRFPIWSNSRFLARMASKSPASVVEILSAIDTENDAVYVDIVDAALAVPPKDAASLVPSLSNAARNQRMWWAFDKASGLCVHLARGGEADAAVELAGALFAPTFAPNEEEPTAFYQRRYVQGISEATPWLARTRPSEFLARLLNWLNTAVEARKLTNSESYLDYSFVWRPAVEEHPQNNDYEFAAVLVGIIRDFFEEAIKRGGLSLGDALSLLKGYRYSIFARLRIYLIAEFATANQRLARETMMDRSLFEDYKYRHEYAGLVGRRLNLLNLEERSKWFSWIHSGPDLKDFEEYVIKAAGRKPTQEEIRKRIDWWKFERLHWVREDLDGERKDFYLLMVAEHGEPDMADLIVKVGGVRSVAVEELASGDLREAIELLAARRYDHGGKGALEGVASSFQQFVATDPETFSHEARVLIGQDAMIVRPFIQEMASAVKDGKDIALPPVLDLCVWSLEQPAEGEPAQEQEDGGILDRSWQWTRDEVSRLLANICKAREGSAPRYQLEALRVRIWEIIAALCRSSVESYIPMDFGKEEARVHDFFELGLNSPRGKAVGAALEYARWVASNLTLDIGGEGVPGGFSSIPEVRDELEWQLASENRAPETLGVIGAHIGLLFWIDRHWLHNQKKMLFDLKGTQEQPVVPEGWAAWNAFLVWTRPHVDYFRLFEEQFTHAVEEAASVERSEPSRNQPMNHLAEHLMILYARGDLNFDHKNALLNVFIETANPDIRRYAISFMGRVAQNDEEMPADVLQRIMALWDLYWAGPGQRDAKENPGADLFGSWFLSRHLPEEWRLDRLEKFSEAVPRPQPDDRVVEELAKLTGGHILKALQVLDRMVRSDQEGWRVQLWLDSMSALLITGLEAGSEERTLAEALINYLGRRGYVEFGELLGA